MLVGVVGYLIIGYPEHGLIDAVYMTMITLTTVGYEEAIELSGRPGGMLFTSALLVFGVGSFAYLFSHLTAFAFEGGVGIGIVQQAQVSQRIFHFHPLEKPLAAVNAVRNTSAHERLFQYA